MSGGIWTVEQHHLGEGPETNRWCVADEDGEPVCFFATREAAEEWLDFQAAAAEARAEGDR